MKNNNGYQILESNRDEIINLYKKGWGRKKIAEKYGVGKQTASEFLAKIVSENIDLKKEYEKRSHYNNNKNNLINNLSNQEIEQIIAFFKVSKSREETKRKFGLTNYKLDAVFILGGKDEFCSPYYFEFLKNRLSISKKFAVAENNNLSDNINENFYSQITPLTVFKKGLRDLLDSNDDYEKLLPILNRTIEQQKQEIENLKNQNLAITAENQKLIEQKKRFLGKLADAQNVLGD